MKQYPITFSAPMVRALLAGRKQQTRRIMRPADASSVFRFPTGDGRWRWFCRVPQVRDRASKVPINYDVGDHLYVRESLVIEDVDRRAVTYRADMPDDCERKGWRAARYAPRWTSRIVLQVTDIRCERLSEITESDAAAEGAEPYLGSYRQGFKTLWDSIHGDGSFEKNPFVVVTTFAKMENTHAE